MVTGAFSSGAVIAEHADRQTTKGQKLQSTATMQDFGHYLAKDGEAHEGLSGPLHGSALCSQRVGTQ